jgi:hypothetical protein
MRRCAGEVHNHKNAFVLTIFAATVGRCNVNLEPPRVSHHGMCVFPLKFCFWTGQEGKTQERRNCENNHAGCYKRDPPLIGSESLHKSYSTPMLGEILVSSVTS